VAFPIPELKSKNYILLKIIFNFEHLTINKYLCNTTIRCTCLSKCNHASCAIGASKSIVAHWDPLSMRPCAPCKLWLIILLFHVSIKVFFNFVSWFCHCLHSFATRRFVVLACRNAIGFKCILRLIAEMKMLKYPRIAIFEGTSY
jgi:hypothetical protein